MSKFKTVFNFNFMINKISKIIFYGISNRKMKIYLAKMIFFSKKALKYTNMFFLFLGSIIGKNVDLYSGFCCIHWNIYNLECKTVRILQILVACTNWQQGGDNILIFEYDMIKYCMMIAPCFFYDKTYV